MGLRPESSIGRLDKGRDEAKINGWTVVSMKDDWKTIFPSETSEPVSTGADEKTEMNSHPASGIEPRIGLRSNIPDRSVQFIFSLALCYLNISLLPAERLRNKLRTKRRRSDSRRLIAIS
jgi:hypothetical protein